MGSGATIILLDFQKGTPFPARLNDFEAQTRAMDHHQSGLSSRTHFVDLRHRVEAGA